MDEARAIAEETARASYGRLLAWLSARTRDVSAAEDALAEAFRAALEAWPRKGVPAAPEAWLLTAARRRLIDAARREKTRQRAEPALSLAMEEADDAARREAPFPDERLKLLFICAHPAIDAGVRTPLMLQTVLGLDAARIASAFLVSPASMGQRLVRAKRKIKDASIPFETPSPGDFGPRIDAVLEAIYAAFTAGWNDPESAAAGGDLTREAIYLGELLARLAPDAGEAWGLLALILHADARRAARRVDGRYIPLSDQDASLWDHDMVARAERALARAWRCDRIGPYQLQAAIQSAHAASKLKGRDTHAEILALYEKLIELAPTVGAAVAYSAALANAGRAQEALAVLEQIDAGRISRYQAYWAVRAHVLAALERPADAAEAYDRAIGLADDDATRTFLKGRARRPT